MKKIGLITLITLFALSFTISAQNIGRRNTPQQRDDTALRWTAKERADNMAKQLELTDDQKAEVEALLKKHDEERKAEVEKHIALRETERETLRNNREARRTEMQESREKAVAENDAELEKIIGKEKLEEWKEYRTNLQQERRDINRSDRRNIVRGGRHMPKR